ncbi:hypothetical protein NQ314_002751 [Rhamnusium bicolor]|uniref:Uncharacterized protein n=1 Tax=Rhamnusium bicolor TaxID=1586634 RepID=A0AAV8ZPR0_9CUCU|nr:hypothetical protein NQ314_002751 [Rhamnusium bicolor]
MSKYNILISGQKQCWIEFKDQWKWKLYMTLVSLTLFAIPAAIITTCYTVIIITIWTKSTSNFNRPKKHLTGGRLGNNL